MARPASGSLDRWITIERATVTISGRGNETRAWGPLATIRAQRMPQRATEAWKAGGTAAELETGWRIRWTSTVADVSPADRIVWGDSVMAIIGVTEIGRREGIEIVTKGAA